MNFIKTTDASIKKRLFASGYTCLYEQGQMAVFLNNGKLLFDESDKKKVVFTNKLEM